MDDRYFFTLDELLADPMVKLVMARDGVDARAFRTMFEREGLDAEVAQQVPPAHVIAACCGHSACA